jgi:hypothetical protein
VGDELRLGSGEILAGEWTMIRQRVLSAAILVAMLTPAYADDGCDKFGWSVARERAWFAATNKSAVAAGATLAPIPNGAFILQLQPDMNAAFAMPPERKPKAEHWFGGIIRLPAATKPGIYQVTLSDEAWIDVIQDSRYARSIGSTGRSDCQGLRKSVRFELNASPIVVQLSGVMTEMITVAVSRND